MKNRDILDAAPLPARPSRQDARALGPSDLSDSPSDLGGVCEARELPTSDADLPILSPAQAVNVRPGMDSDAAGTGERSCAVPGESIPDAADIRPDRVRPTPDPIDPPEDEVRIEEPDKDTEARRTDRPRP